MLEVVYGTGNPGKVRQMQAGLGLYHIKVRGISEFDVRMDVPEDGRTPEELVQTTHAYMASLATFLLQRLR